MAAFGMFAVWLAGTRGNLLAFAWYLVARASVTAVLASRLNGLDCKPPASEFPVVNE